MDNAPVSQPEAATPVIDPVEAHPAVVALKAWKPQALKSAAIDRKELTVTVEAVEIVGVCRALREAGYNFFEDMTAVDWFPSAPRFQLSYHLLSHRMKEHIRVRAFVDGDAPSIPSITPVWMGANFYEREVFDLFGIRFEGHPNLRRILMPDEWQGHPLRKDYPVEGYR